MFHKISAYFAKYQDVEVAKAGAVVWQQRMLDLHNAQRKGNGRPLLAVNFKLQDAAQKHATWMGNTGIMSHTGQNGSSMTDRINAEHYPWSNIGENVAYGYPTIEAVVKGWMESYGHRMNIMNPNFTQVGFGMGKHSDGTVFWCADFGRPQ